MWILVPQPWIEPASPALEDRLNHWSNMLDEADSKIVRIPRGYKKYRTQGMQETESQAVDLRVIFKERVIKPISGNIGRSA